MILEISFELISVIVATFSNGLLWYWATSTL